MGFGDIAAGMQRGDVHTERRDQLHRLKVRGGREPQHFTGAADVGRFQMRVRRDEVDLAAVVDDRVDPLRQRLECRRRQAEQRAGQIAQHRHQSRIVAFAPQSVTFEIAADTADAVFGAVGADQAHHFGRAEVDEIAQHVRTQKAGGAGQQHGFRRSARRYRRCDARAVNRRGQRDLGLDVEDLDRFAGEQAVDGRGQAGDGRRGEHRRQRQFDAQRFMQFEHQRQR